MEKKISDSIYCWCHGLDWCFVCWKRISIMIEMAHHYGFTDYPCSSINRHTYRHMHQDEHQNWHSTCCSRHINFISYRSFFPQIFGYIDKRLKSIRQIEYTLNYSMATSCFMRNIFWQFTSGNLSFGHMDDFVLTLLFFFLTS